MPSALSAALAGSPLAAQLRDIHPGPALGSAVDPRLLGWGWLLIILLCALLITTLALALWRQRRWARQIEWQEAELVPRLQAVLRQAALAHWPEARHLQGEAWLAWLDARGGSRFAEFAPLWPHWLYGRGEPDATQQAALRRCYLRWGRRCVSPPRLLTRATGWGRRHDGGAT
ncbi:DUF4381 family protein [Aeromonas encheleia]|uniref:DUF4381 domain-containing protein n=1 Tax=Aeromonas encheleia TaxID=73010 RepID=A0AAE9SFH9_9GAMM|nr:DUF4381 family protein [Aeromonas encheleia]USV59482.1 DUF4381 domain-containing protein [Aeromonas encheleia]